MRSAEEMDINPVVTNTTAEGFSKLCRVRLVDLGSKSCCTSISDEARHTAWDGDSLLGTAWEGIRYWETDFSS